MKLWNRMRVIQTNVMKRIIAIILCLAGLLAVSSCQDKLDIVFTDYYTYIDDGNGSSYLEVERNDAYVITMYIHIVVPTLDDMVTVDYEVTPGNGLVEGVDYKLAASSKTIAFQPGIYKMPVRIELLKSSALDVTKDNTITITLVGNSAGMGLGKPGPDAKYKSFVIKKI